MKAMILAAGLGTRLRPLTDHCPKALVTIAGRTLLEITLARLRVFGVHEVIVNTHHHADMIADYLRANHNFGMRIEISHEEVLLDTGGGLKNATHFFLAPDASPEEPFIIHNVDVLSSIDLERLKLFHVEHVALATLAVQDRRTSRYLLFNQEGELRGRRSVSDGQDELVRSAGEEVRALAFSGIHVVSPGIFLKMQGEGAFSIIPAYLRLAAEGEKIVGFGADEYYWRDLGRLEDLSQASADVAKGVFPDI